MIGMRRKTSTGEGGDMTTTAQIVKAHLSGSRKVVKAASRSKQSALAFLIKAGIAEKTKDGARLAKAYR
jgi:hypothetical protein